ncbi:MAG TPA: choice-of-anchor tandem repeat GloVer-containing protein [Candidatus Polarisedimenticolia bacterium]|nr:choice-of-anchor tandem repeat GloVer-containing protein [Candidatus Polarisedimenticolia bacterium]
MIAGLLVTAALLAGTAKGSAAQAAVQPAFKVLHVFNKQGDGQAPMAGVQADAAGNLFGSAEFGGANGFGAIFMLKPPASGMTNWIETVIFSFADGDDGGFPSSPMIVEGNRDLVSSTLMGGTANQGNIFRLSLPTNDDESWTEKVLFNFQGAPRDGSGPLGPQLVLQNGTTFGTTSSGGASNCGTAYQLTPGLLGNMVEEKILFNFTCGADGGRPQEGLVTDGKGILFGTTEAKGSLNNGVVFELVTAGNGLSEPKERTIFAFNITDGAQPVGNLLAFNGSLYGVTFQGGQFGQGVVFRLIPPAQPGGIWKETVLHSFSGGTDGGEPQSGLIPDGKGGFFGTASQGGTTGNGNFFDLVPPAQTDGAWTLTPLHQFAGGNDGSDPSGDLLKRGDAIFGTTQGSATGQSTVYRIIP